MGNKMKRNGQQGFTLIELIMVIVILGILAATALPKFVDLSSDARKSTIEGMLGAVRSTLAIVHSKALIDGKTGAAAADQKVSINGTDVLLAFGYPKDTTELLKSMDYDSSSFAANGTAIEHQTATTKASCAITFSVATSATAPASAALVGSLNCS